MAKKHIIDKEMVNEIILTSENERDLYLILTTTYLDNLKKKRLKGTYDKKASYKLMEYFYQNHIRPSLKKRTSFGFDPKLNPSERALIGKYYADKLWDDFLKHIKPLKTMKKRKPKVSYMGAFSKNG